MISYHVRLKEVNFFYLLLLQIAVKFLSKLLAAAIVDRFLNKNRTSTKPQFVFFCFTFSSLAHYIVVSRFDTYSTFATSRRSRGTFLSYLCP